MPDEPRKRRMHRPSPMTMNWIGTILASIGVWQAGRVEQGNLNDGQWTEIQGLKHNVSQLQQEVQQLKNQRDWRTEKDREKMTEMHKWMEKWDRKWESGRQP